VFVGSDSTLVAPLKIGKGAYIAAASCITEDVAQDALAVGRARQIVKEGWAKASGKLVPPRKLESTTETERHRKPEGLLCASLTFSLRRKNKKKARSPGSSVPRCLPGGLALLRNRRKQIRVHQRLELFVVGLKVQLQLRAVGIHRQRIDRDLLDRTGIHLLIEHARLDRDDIVAAVIESDVMTSRLKFTPLEKSMV